MFSSTYYQIVCHVIFIKYRNSILRFFSQRLISSVAYVRGLLFGVGPLIIYVDKLVDDLGFYVYFIGRRSINYSS